MRFLNAAGTVLASAVVADKLPLYLYVDDWTYTGQALADEYIKMAKAGASHIIMGFHLIGNPNFPNNIADSVLAWSNLPDTIKQTTIKAIHDAGAKLLVSAGGESEGKNWQSVDPTQYGKTTCTALKAMQVDGVDFDKEGIAWVDKTVLDWTNAAVKACRSVWPEAFMTSAPQSPYFNPAAQGGLTYADGLKSGAAFDRYLIQFYNQWPNYDTYEQLFSNKDQNMGPSIATIFKAFPNAPKNTFVVGKPRQKGDGNHEVPLDTLKQWVCQAEKEFGYTGGIMLWKHHLGTDVSYITDLVKSCGNDPKPDPVPITTTSTQTTAEQTTAEQTTAEQTTAEQTTAEQTTAEQTTAEQTTAEQTTAEKTTAEKTTAEQTTQNHAPAPGIVGDCEKLVSGGPGFAHYDEICRGYCADYIVGGPRAPWCTGTDGKTLAACITKERTYCVIH